jgi:hypothetical protein
MRALVESGDLEGRARTRGRFLEDQRDLFAVQRAFLRT